MKKSLLFYVFLCLCIGFSCLNIQAQPIGWSHVKAMNVTENSGAVLTDYQLRLEINTEMLISAGQMQASGDDIRFGADVNGTTLLNHWIESGINTANTVIWVKVPLIPANGSTPIFLFYGNASASSASFIDGTFIGPHSSTDSITSGGSGGVANSQRGFRFSPNEDILVNRFGKREPNGSTRYITLFDYATQAIIIQHQVSGAAGQYHYADLNAPLWLTQGTQYLLEMYQGDTDGYYFGVSSQIGEHLTYYDMRYCNSCSQNTFPTLPLGGYQYGYPDLHYYTKQNVTPAPTYAFCPDEVCDGADNDCDGMVDEDVQTLFYRDFDTDGFGNPSSVVSACSQPSGYVTNNTDCNDNSALEKPGQVWYKDTDGDGYAQTATATITQCTRPVGYKAASELTSTTGDCNDNNAAIKPGATEICDGLDNDCDEEVDEGVQTPFFLDADSDGYYTGSPILACSSPGINYVTSVIGGNDCNDNNPIEKPGQVWYKDTDGDGYAQTGAATITQCARPVGYKVASELTSTTGDCNDNNAAIKPGATEICDGLDNNCNGSTDEGLPFATYYTDADGDGYGTGVGQSLCANPGQGFATQAGDCNDNNAAVKPGATEICDGLDNNCNGTIDEPSPIGSPWSSGDVGAPGVNGSATNSCSVGSDVLNVSATGFSMPNSDKMHFVYQPLCGNGSITARVANVTGGGWAGVMMRESLSPGAKKAVLKTQLSNFIRRELRTTTNGATSSFNFNRPVHQWLQLTRSGNVVTGFTSPDGTNWDFAFSATVSMGSCIQVGFFSESINVNAVTTASFDNVSVSGGVSLQATTPTGPAAGQDVFTNNWDVELFPNPSSGLVNLSFSGTPQDRLEVRVLNTLGETVAQWTNLVIEAGQLPLNLTYYPAGIYFLHISTPGSTPVVKRVVLADK